LCNCRNGPPSCADLEDRLTDEQTEQLFDAVGGLQNLQEPLRNKDLEENMVVLIIAHEESMLPETEALNKDYRATMNHRTDDRE
jgi:hypothetical protein